VIYPRAAARTEGGPDGGPGVKRLRTFENLAKRYGVNESELSRTLEPYLTGNAQRAYFSLSEDERKNYTKVKETILARYKLTSAAYCSKFRKEEKTHDESFLEFVARLEEYMIRWLRPSDKLLKDKEAKTLLDKFVVI
jgi:hypothetical protein